MEIKTVDLANKFSSFSEHWSPKLVGELNGQHVKIVKILGEFIWHKHDEEDELFMVMKGQLFIELRDKTIELSAGQFTIIPRGIEHRPYAKEEAEVLMFEPASTLNTGDQQNERTKMPERI